MTNSLVQNIEQNQNNDAIDMMMQAFNMPSSNKTQEQSSFSNLISKLDARTQKAQTNFDKQAKVTNTSSINRKALEPKDDTNIKNTKQNNQKTIENNNIQKPKETLKEENETTNENIDIKTTETEKTQNTDTTNKTTKNEVDINATNSEELSDINNSSPVETSPVFSSDISSEENKDTTTETDDTLENINKNLQDIINILPVANNATSTNETQKTDTDIKNLFENIENTEELPKIIENISSELNNSTLNQEQKDELLDILNNLKKVIETNEDTTIETQDFSEELSNLKTKIDEIFKDSSIETDANTEITNENDLSEIKLEIKKPLDNTISKDNTDNETIKEATKLIEEISNDIEDLKNYTDNDKLNSIKENLSKLFETVKTNSSDNLNETNINEDIIKPLENLKETIENLKTTLENTKNTDVEIIPIEDNTDTKETFEILDKLNNKNLENIDIKDENTKKEIINLLDNLNNELENQNSTKEIKKEIENLIEKINTQEISSDELTQTIKDLSDEIKPDTSNTQKQNIETNTNQSTNTIDLTNKFEKFTNSENNSQSQNNSNEQFKNIDLENLKSSQENEDNTIDVDFNSNEIELKGKISENADTKEVEQNLQKAVAIENMLDEMMVEVDIKNIPSNSGALSVSDEIAKLAMGEVNSLTSNTSIHGSITYDSTGISAVIKNAASLIKTTPAQNTSAPSMEDILNQVTNKITQLKDGTTQKLTMILRPNDLGRLSIELISNQDGLTTQIMAQNDDVRAYIEKNINSLRQQLTDAGVNVNNIQIKTQGQEGSTNYEGNQNLAKNEQENQNQQNNENKNNNQQQRNDNKDSKDILASISNYDMSFAKDFSSVLNKSISYSLN